MFGVWWWNLFQTGPYKSLQCFFDFYWRSLSCRMCLFFSANQAGKWTQQCCNPSRVRNRMLQPSIWYWESGWWDNFLKERNTTPQPALSSQWNLDSLLPGTGRLRETALKTKICLLAVSALPVIYGYLDTALGLISEICFEDPYVITQSSLSINVSG